MVEEISMEDCEKMMPKPKGILGMPIWTWGLLIASIILFLFVTFLDRDTGINVYPSLENKTCDEMVELYQVCLQEKEKPKCMGYFADPILGCYGEQTLNDQLVLINQT